MHGQGGGVLYAPIQLLFGVDFHTAVQQSLWFTILTALSAVLLFRKDRQVDWALALVLESSSFAGAFLSGYFAKLFPPRALTALLAALVFAAGIAMLLQLAPRKDPRKRAPWHWIRQRGGHRYCVNLAQGLPLSFLIGIVSGLTGAAGGVPEDPDARALVRRADQCRLRIVGLDGEPDRRRGSPRTHSDRRGSVARTAAAQRLRPGGIPDRPAHHDANQAPSDAQAIRAVPLRPGLPRPSELVVRDPGRGSGPCRESLTDSSGERPA